MNERRYTVELTLGEIGALIDVANCMLLDSDAYVWRRVKPESVSQARTRLQQWQRVTSYV